ncbi:unnamed protein product [Phaeothamnion confervicola]
MAGTCTETSVPEKYQDQGSFFEGTAPLDVSIGYIIVLGFGVFFSIFCTVLVWMDKRFNNTTITSEQFNTAGRSVKTGLTAAVIVSQWTWAATLLQSSNVAFKYGVSGPFWYASGATIQVLLFGILAIELKRKAPSAHTFLEIVKARWGTTAHGVFFVFAILTNIIVSSMLLLGGSATVAALTGMDVNLASFLIPWGVILYTCAGGLKATFMAHYIQTAIIVTILVLFVFFIYAGPSKYVGSASAMYNKLEEVSNIENCAYGPECQYTLTACGPVDGNQDGSYLTMLSKNGLIFGVINIVGNFGTVFIDQAYWQSAIAANPEASVRGYLIGGMCWFAIPFSLATSLGLGVVAMQLPVTLDESNSGLTPPACALYTLGQGGAVLLLIQLFMAIVSTGSGELIAVSSLVAYDVYRTYLKPTATGEDILRISRYFIVGFGLLMGVLAVALNEIGLSLGWVYLFMGVVIGSAVLPVAFLMLWSKCTATGAWLGAVIGMICGFVSWIATASALEGEVTVDTLGMDYPMLTGNVIAIGMGGIVSAGVSLMNPDNFTWDETRAIKMVDEDEVWGEEYTEEALAKSRSWIMKYGIGFTIICVILWPILSLPAGVFSMGYFKFWVGISCVWALAAAFITVFMPLFESRKEIGATLMGIMTCGAASPAPAKKAEPEVAMGAETKAGAA